METAATRAIADNRRGKSLPAWAYRQLSRDRLRRDDERSSRNEKPGSRVLANSIHNDPQMVLQVCVHAAAHDRRARTLPRQPDDARRQLGAS